MQKFLQKLEGVSQALLDPLSYLTAAGLLLVVGALLTSSPLRQLLPVLNWTPIRLAGGLLYNSMMVIVNNLSIFLCVGIAAARTRTEKQEAALLALMAYLVFLTANHTTLEILGRLAEADGLTGLAATGQTSILGIQVMDTGVTASCWALPPRRSLTAPAKRSSPGLSRRCIRVCGGRSCASRLLRRRSGWRSALSGRPCRRASVP